MLFFTNRPNSSINFYPINTSKRKLYLSLIFFIIKASSSVFEHYLDTLNLYLYLTLFDSKKNYQKSEQQTSCPAHLAIFIISIICIFNNGAGSQKRMSVFDNSPLSFSIQLICQRLCISNCYVLFLKINTSGFLKNCEKQTQLHYFKTQNNTLFL